MGGRRREPPGRSALSLALLPVFPLSATEARPFIAGSPLSSPVALGEGGESKAALFLTTSVLLGNVYSK